MDTHLIEVRELADIIEEVDINIPEDIIVYYTLKNLPKEYEIFKRMQIAAQTLPTYEKPNLFLKKRQYDKKLNRRRTAKRSYFTETEQEDLSWEPDMDIIFRH